jgi:secreted PhoX family phosphatase
VFAGEGDGGTKDLWDMNTQNETGKQAGRFLYRTHETSSGSQVSVTDLETNSTRVLAEREDWERFDGIVWTPWGTILAAEEVNRSAAPDPEVPQAQAGLVYEFFLDPDDPTQLDESINQDGETPGVVPRPALGSKSHEGMRFDPQGNLYSISESNPGYVFRFVPDNQNEQNNDPSTGEDDLSSREDNLSNGQLYALKVTEPTGDRTGEAVWQPLDRAAVQVNATAEATAEQATGYNRPEDVELTTSTGNNATGTGANTVYVSITGEGDNRVLGIDLREPASGSEHLSAFVYDYVRVGENAPEDFEAPDNLALDRNGNLYITEDPPQNPPGKGADIWVAEPPSQRGEQPLPAENVVRFASLTDCNAEPTGIYFKMTGRPGGDGDGAVVNQNSETLFVNVQHRGGDGRDLAVAITQAQEGSSSRSAGGATDPSRTTESTTTSEKTKEKTKEQ